MRYSPLLPRNSPPSALRFRRPHDPAHTTPALRAFTATELARLLSVQRNFLRTQTPPVGQITERNGLSVTDIDLSIPHQANLRIIQAAVEKLACLWIG